jgi:hypothetical protein
LLVEQLLLLLAKLLLLLLAGLLLLLVGLLLLLVGLLLLLAGLLSLLLEWLLLLAWLMLLQLLLLLLWLCWQSCCHFARAATAACLDAAAIAAFLRHPGLPPVFLPFLLPIIGGALAASTRMRRGLAQLY